MRSLPHWLGSGIALALILTACGPAATPPVPTALPELYSTASGEVDLPTVAATDLPGVPVSSDTNLLIILEGEARITHDNGSTWTATGTGQYLQTGDEIQTSNDAIALVFLLNGGVVRLEGPSDLQIMRAERDVATGATKIIVKLWDGYGLFDTNPLPTPDSLFQFHVMTTFISLEYDAESAAAVGPDTALDPEWSVIAGGLLNEETERLYHFRGPASLFMLDQLSGVTFAAELPTARDEVADLDAAFLDDYELEAELEAFGVTAGYLIAECKLLGDCEGVDISGNTVARVEELESGQTLYFFGRDPAAGDQVSSTSLLEAAGVLRTLAALQVQAAADPGSAVGEVTIGRMTWRTTTGLPGTSRSPTVTEGDVVVLAGDPQDFGCNPNSGFGCMPPQGCDQASGAGCELPSGCNVITESGCQPPEIALKVWEDPSDSILALRLEYPAAIDPGCTPNTPGDCDLSYDPEQWADRDELDDDEVAACWCPANPPPPGYGPPPPGTFMYYRCFCSDRGAMRDRPSQ